MAALAAAIFPASAQMSLHDCLLFARDHAPDNIISRLESSKAEATAHAAAAAFVPYLGLYSNANLSFGRNIDPETNTYDNKKTLGSGFGISMSLPLFDGLVTLNTLKASRVACLRQRKSGQERQDKISLEVIKAFYNVAYCKAMAVQMEEQLRRDSTHLAATKMEEELGTKSGADVAELAALVASDEFELTNQRNILQKALLSLKAVMGMDPETQPFEIVELPYQPGPPVPKHPRLEEAELSLTESRHLLNVAKGGFYPSLSFNAGISTSYYRLLGEGSFPSFSSQWSNNMGQYIGVSLSIPLSQGVTNINKVKIAKINLLEAEANLDRVRLDLQKEITEAELDLEGAIRDLEAAQRLVEAEQLAYNATRRKYELGTSSAIDLYTATAKLATAKATLEGKRIQKIISRITLAYCLGEALINPQYTQ